VSKVEGSTGEWRVKRWGEEGRGTVGEVEMEEDGGNDGWVGEKGEDGHLATATTLRAVPGAEQRQDLVDASDQQVPVLW